MYMVELHDAEKPIFAIIDTMLVNVSSALTQFPSQGMVDPGEGSFTCQVNHCVEVREHYTTAP